MFVRHTRAVLKAEVTAEEEIHGDTPRIRWTGTETDGRNVHLREDSGNLVLQDETSGADVRHVDSATGDELDDITITKGTPLTKLKGTEANAIEVDVKEDGGRVTLTDITNDVDLLRLTANDPLVCQIPIPIIFETAQTGLDASTTGVKFTSQNIIPTIGQYATLSIEASWRASETDGKTTIELYDEDAGSVLTSVSGNTETDKRTGNVGFTEGHSLVIRVNVTTASATSTATVDVDKVVAYQRIRPSG